MKKIVIFLPSLQHGGLQRSLIEAMSVVDIEKYDITLYVYRECNALRGLFPDRVKVIVDTDKSHYKRKLKSLLLHMVLLLSKIFRNKKYIDSMSKKIHAFVHGEKAKYPARKYFSDGVDVAISYAMGLCTEMVVELKADKKFLFFHSSDPNFHRDLSDKYFDKFDNIIAVGKNVQDMLQENFPLAKDKIALIKNYINPDNVRTLSKEYTVNKNNDKLILASVMRIDKEKGADMIVPIAKKLKDSGVNFLWYVVGDGAQREEINQQIIQNNLDANIIQVGFKDNPHPYIKQCDLFVHPAYEESFGLSILEALYLEKPIVSTDTMGAREVLNDGQFGLLVSINTDSIADGILSMINNPELKIKYQSNYRNSDETERALYREKWETILNGEVL